MTIRFLSVFLCSMITVPMFALAQESEITTTGGCVFTYASPSSASLIRGEAQVTTSVELVDGEAWTSGSHDARVDLPYCDSAGGYCVKLAGTPLFIPADEALLDGIRWKHAGYLYVAGIPFVDLSRGPIRITPIFAYADINDPGTGLDFDTVFFIDEEKNLRGYSFWKHDVRFGSQPIKMLSNYWLVGDKAPISCFKGGKKQKGL